MQDNKTMKLTLKLLGLTSVAVMLTGCADYLARHEGVTFDAGDASARNAAIHTIDPWPRHAGNNRIDVDGKRIGVAVKTYQTNEPEGTSKAPQVGLKLTGPGSQGSTSN